MDVNLAFTHGGEPISILDLHRCELRQIETPFFYIFMPTLPVKPNQTVRNIPLFQLMYMSYMSMTGICVWSRHADSQFNRRLIYIELHYSIRLSFHE